MKLIALCTLLLFFPRTTSQASPRLFVVWDVGQGLWATAVLPHTCIHFDMGGENFTHSHILKKWCFQKNNALALSHLDKDHVRFIKKFSRSFNLCLINKDQFPKHKDVNALDTCKTIHGLQQIYRSNFTFKNESHIYSWNNTVLAPGDAYKKQERMIHQKLSARFLLVGHHGSRTSSSDGWIRRLPSLQQALVSARKKKYGHPHINTVKTFKKYYVPLIETNNFGHLIYEL